MEKSLDQVDVGDDQPVEVPIFEGRQDGPLFRPGQMGVAGAKMTGADFLSVKTIIPQVPSLVHRRMEQAPYSFLLPIQEAQEFAVVDLLQEL
jgi:hypothetical protein